MSGQKRHRIFIAINLPQEEKKYLSEFERKWSNVPAKWTPQENLHITLAFLGDIYDEQLGEVCMAVKQIAEKHASFDINLQKIAYGPDEKISPRPPKFSEEIIEEEKEDYQSRKFWRPRMIWVSGQKSKELSLLKRDLEDALLEKVNFKPETRSFSPHITLARVNAFAWRTIDPEERQDVNEDIDINFTVESIEVMESELKKGGPRYTVIESHTLHD